MLFKVSPHIKKLSLKSPAVKKQFYSSDFESVDILHLPDPLLEEAHTKTRGLVHKYSDRVLILLTLNCAAYCRFCTRKRNVSQVARGIINGGDIIKMKEYIIKNKNINEIIFSGGDPMTVPVLLSKAMNVLGALPQIKIIRIGTRLPVSDPGKVDVPILKIIKRCNDKPVYVMVHFEHPDEITHDTVLAVNRLRKAGAILFSQSVFLKGVNDDYDTLFKLFSRLIEIGVKPYYIFRCDPVQGAEHFIADFKKEVDIMTRLRTTLSGLAYPMYVIDTPNGSGKVPVALNFWEFDHTTHLDFEMKKKDI